MFEGDPAPMDLATPGFNATEWTLRHNAGVIDPILAKAVAYLQSRGIERIATTGYCFGGRYAFRLLAPGKGVDAGFSAHPSLLENGEILAITKPISVAAAGGFFSLLLSFLSLFFTCCASIAQVLTCTCTEIDTMMPPARRLEIEGLLANNVTQPYQVNLYGGAAHGFGVRGDVSDPEQKFAKEAAFYQAVRWFSAWA